MKTGSKVNFKKGTPKDRRTFDGKVMSTKRIGKVILWDNKATLCSVEFYENDAPYMCFKEDLELTRINR